MREDVYIFYDEHTICNWVSAQHLFRKDSKRIRNVHTHDMFQWRKL